MQHPFLHPVEMIEYLVDHQRLLIVQPRRFNGSLKDLIYKVATQYIILYFNKFSIIDLLKLFIKLGYTMSYSS